MVILGAERAVIILLGIHIGRVEVEQSRWPVVDLDKVSEVLVLDVHSPEPFPHLLQVLHGVVDLLGAGGVGAVVTAEADLDRIEEAGRPLNVRQDASLSLREAIKELLP